MEELIRITTNEQGSLVVSARELHELLGVKARFNDWIKRRIIKYGLREGVDYVEVEGAEGLKGEERVLLKSEYNPGGRPETDYGLPLDVAKELCMVENNEQGRTTRRYFIEAEKALRQVAAATPPPTPALDPTAMLQLLSRQTQLLTDQQRLTADSQAMIAQLRADVDQIMTGGKPIRRSSGRQLGLPGIPTSPATPPHRQEAVLFRQTIHQRVNAYAEYHQAAPGQAYTYLYKRLFEVYGINVRRFVSWPGESTLDAIERYGHLKELHALVLAELTYRDA